MGRAGALAPGATTVPPAAIAEPAAEPAPRRAALYAWAMLLARISEVFPLGCARCGAAMRTIAYVTDASTIRDILAHCGEPAEAKIPPFEEVKSQLQQRMQAAHLDKYF